MKPYQKLTIVIFLLLESYFAVSAQYENFKQKVFTGSAEVFLSLGQDIHSGRATAEQDWEKLFSTMGYTKYLNNPKGEMIKRELKEAMLLAFDPDRIAEADSILKHPATITNMPLVLRQNICSPVNEKKPTTFLSIRIFSPYCTGQMKRQKNTYPNEPGHPIRY